VMARIDKETKDKYLVGYVILKQEYELSVFELRNYLKEKLPEYMIPTAFVLMDSFPLNANGKVDKKLLPEPDQINLGLEVTYVGPRSPIEELLVDIWSGILKIEKIGIYDNFFDLGGHSLLATQVTSRIRDVLQIDLPLRTFFEDPTVAGILNNIEKMKRDSSYSQSLPIQPVTREENLPLSFAQQRLWFLDQLEPGNVSYNIPAAISFKGTLNVQALNQSINEIIRRHEILRTVFKEVEDKPVQVVMPFQQKNIEVIDLTKLVKEKKEYEKNELIKKEAHRAFDLNKGPLIRECLIKLDELEHILMLNMHHIISDGWSMDVIIKELSTLYEDFCSGGSSSLSELSIQYADFAVWQRDWLQAGTLEKQLAYWKEQLGGELPVLNLPIDRPRTVKQTYQGSIERLVLSKQLTQKVRSLSKQEGTTLFMTLLAAFKTLLYRYTGQEDIIVGSPIANRNRSEIEGLVGFFVNTLPLRTKLSGDKTFREVLKLIRETSLEAYAHQDVPFEKLVEEIHP
ncbi:condensation domain-containing protein, partial [Bacillus cereus group sp. BfR-BA-01381]|uniref:condensation domain-containing protein n=1 Tax=Bacillus cereus group sp. BfR-BA-01381 TaxID=2920325 RepID=UPI001F55EB60